ncbi:response regulator [Salegentibacter sp. LM13S]|uniref:response regulator n=1 Tax=Salegentibacter lacus TaxID=2873599 RepID=UPI001CCD0020|nr:response regulator [Salegentibacter lacus]MBZ9629732.1 response regulator [Salegentibacter lacus]
MKNTLSILMVDDHPMILEGYKNTLLQEKDFNLEIDTATNCDTAISKLERPGSNYDIVLLDIKIPPCANGKILSGEDLGVFIRQKFLSTKIIILTMFSEKIRLTNIIENVNPDSFLIKSEVMPLELVEAVKGVMNGEKYYSETIKKLNKQQNQDSVLDDYDRRIIFQLSKGTKTSHLVDYIPLSLGAIEKRKRRIKEVFGINRGGDREILDKARQLGYL